MQETKYRDAAALMEHHIASVAQQDVEVIMSDYDEELVAINNLDGTLRIIEGKAPLREQVEETIELARKAPKTDAPPLEPTILLYKGEGDYMISSGYFGEQVLFEAYTYVTRKGMARYVTGFSKKAHQHLPEVIPKKTENSSMHLAEELIRSMEENNPEGIIKCYAENAKILTNLAAKSLNGKEEIRGFYENLLKSRKNPRQSKPQYYVYEALHELVYFVYENEQGITEETYLTENGSILFASIVNRNDVEMIKNKTSM